MLHPKGPQVWGRGPFFRLELPERGPVFHMQVVGKGKLSFRAWEFYTQDCMPQDWGCYAC